MCGRFTLRLTSRLLAAFFCIEEPELWEPRYNIAPSQSLLAILPGSKTIEWFRPIWGLVPLWAQDTKIMKPLINARAETVQEKASFREAFKHRRCLIPADGFFEWKGTARGKTPFLFFRGNNEPFAFAGLWELGKDLEKPTCAIVTTSANSVVESIHERMPVMLTPSAFKLWLDGTIDEASSVLRPFPDEDFFSERVSERVNSSKNDDEGCIRRELNLLD